MQVPPHTPVPDPRPRTPGTRHLERVRDVQIDQLQSSWARFGPDDARTLDGLENLAATLTDLGEFDRACALQERTLAVCDETIGPRHPHALRNAWLAFRNLQCANQRDQALGLYRERLAWLLATDELRLDPDVRPIRGWLEAWAEVLAEADTPTW